MEATEDQANDTVSFLDTSEGDDEDFTLERLSNDDLP